MKKNALKKNGFTLIEMILAMSIVFLVLGASLDIFRDSVRTSDAFIINMNSQSEIRRAFKTMSNYIRSASPSSLGAYPIDSVGTSSFIFYSDIDGDNLKERVRYFVNSGYLKEGILKPNGSPLTYNPANEKISKLLNNIVNTSTAPIFEYYDGNYDGTSAPLSYPITLANIRLVKIRTLINQNPKKTPVIIMEFITQASIRNLKDNL